MISHLNTRKIATAMLVAVSPIALANVALADTAPVYKTQDTFLKTADEALAAVTNIHTARLALFNNDIAKAKESVEAAKTALTKADSDMSAKLMHDFSNAETGKNYLPFDMSMSLTEGFKETKENTLALQKAYGLFESAAPNDAIEVLKVADIEVQVSTAMLPYETTLTHLDDAIGNIEDGDYFDANIDLKAIADSVVVNTFAIDAIPAQGDIM